MSQFQSVLLLATAVLSAVSTASPMPAPTRAAALEPRAGAPIDTRTIPSACHTSAPFPSATASADTQYQPATAVPTLYSYFLERDPAAGTPEELFASCLDTCFNYGLTWDFSAPDDGGKCRAAWMAFNVANPVDVAAGMSRNASLGAQCLMFNRTMGADDFVKVTNGSVGGANSRAVDLGCPQE